ncbi:UDP-glycosyltransferase [Manduca sexta]|uniref:UDP-glycosyltransferase n=2 Tax=Manduca sexta TaxID=7130 RepID=A0A921ZK90_MANSE|nr:UDP-glycosyltransferase [Manduca sexta]KAG6458619.1 UDP-glycosyltransferase [Manduca sexta]
MKLFVLLVLCLSVVDSYRFLVCNPMAIRSITLLAEGVVRHLLNAGHEVVFITAFPDKSNKNTKLRQIDISENYKRMESEDSLNITYVMENAELNNDLKVIQEIGIDVAVQTMENENIKNFMKETDQHFDAVIVDWIETDLYAGFASVFNAHLIWSYSIGPYYSMLRLVDGYPNPAYSVDPLSANQLPLNFRQRVEELWNQLHWSYVKRFVIYDAERSVYEKYFAPYAAMRNRTLMPYGKAIHNGRLLIANAHHAIGGWPQTPQNFKFVGGCYIDDPPKPLPVDLEVILDNATDGFIYFSMGSLWQSKDIPQQLTEDLLNLFGKFKQTIIWKYEAKLTNKPKNVHLLKWAPQTSILAHPNMKFFITHGGLLSSTEAIHFGVPIIGIPISYDQFHNTIRAISAGFAIKVDLNYDLTKNLEVAMHEMLNNYDTYKEKAREIQIRYHDRPVKASVEVVHWIEHVVKTKGAPHLRSPALHVPLYQKMYLDLLALVIVILLIVLLGLYFSLKKIIKLLSVPKYKKID